MHWFKNLDATPRLLTSFGFMIALALGMGYLGVSSLNKSNHGSQQLYQEDMLGSLRADQMALDRAEIGRLGRDAVLHAGDPEIVGKDEKGVVDAFASLSANLSESQAKVQSQEGQAQLAIIEASIPPYRQFFVEAFADIRAGSFPQAIAAVVAGTILGEKIKAASQACRKMSNDLAVARNAANDRGYRATRNGMLFACVISLVLGVVLSLFIARGFSIPLGNAVIALERVAAGDLTVALQVGTRDEMGRMAGALDNALAKLRSTLREVASGAANTSSASRQLAISAAAISSGSQQQAASLEETSASLEQITAAVRQSADNAHQAKQLAMGSCESAEAGQEVVSAAIAAMANINTASAKISDILSTINEIAFQTNLLAVNAAVEAARAGEQGRGFAVVAAEVRSLAQRSSESAQEIKGLIQDSLDKVKKGSELVNRSGATLQGIVIAVKSVTDIVGEIAAAAAEQSTGIEQVNTAVTQMDQITQSNSAQTEQLATTAQSLSGQSARLSELVGILVLNYAGEDRRGSRRPANYGGRERRSRDNRQPSRQGTDLNSAAPVGAPTAISISSPPRAAVVSSPADLRKDQAVRVRYAGIGAGSDFEEF